MVIISCSRKQQIGLYIGRERERERYRKRKQGRERGRERNRDRQREGRDREREKERVKQTEGCEFEFRPYKHPPITSQKCNVFTH